LTNILIWILAFVLLTCGFICIGYFLHRRKLRFSELLRLLAAGTLLASFGGGSIAIARNVPFAVYVIDVSTSYTPWKMSAIEAMRAHASSLGPDSQAALVTFGESAVLNEPCKIADFKPDADMGVGIKPGFTNIELALQAVSSFKDCAERAYLFTDGQSNAGLTTNGALLCSQAGIKLYPVSLSSPVPDDTWLGDLILPSRANLQEPVKIYLDAGSNMKGKIRISLTTDQMIVHKTVDIVYPGKEERVEFVLTFGEPGIKNLHAKASAEGRGDRFPANNSKRSSIRVMGLPRLIVCSSRSMNVLENIPDLKKRFVLDSVKPEKMPQNLGSLRDTAGVVLDNISAESFSENQKEILERFVRDVGGGLLILGGPNSYGPGGYAETALERVSPLWANPERRKNASLAILIDASGSMERQTQFMGERMSKFRAALKAMLPVYKRMKKEDKIAILTFDTKPSLELPLSSVGDGKRLKNVLADSLLKKTPTGKTDIYPALQSAFEMMDSEKNKDRVLHIILLSDGVQTIEGGINLDMFKEAGIEISTVATGDVPDRARLQKIASETEGKYYEVRDFDVALRDVFIKVISAFSNLTREGNITVAKESHADFTEGIEAYPGLSGIVLTSLKDEAQLVAKTEMDEPVIASWRYGLGQAVAFTGGLDDAWGGEWLVWKDIGKFLTQILRGFEGAARNNNYKLSANVDGLKLTAMLNVEDDGNFIDGLNLRAVFSNANNQRLDLAFKQTGPGRYAAEAMVMPDNMYLITVYNDKKEILATTETWLPASFESDATVHDSGALRRISLLTGGKILTEDEFMKDAPGGKGGRDFELWWLLLFLSGLLFLVDIVQGSVFASRKIK